MKEIIVWKLVYWNMHMVRDGWFAKPEFLLELEYGAYRGGKHPETKYENKRFKNLKSVFNYLENAITESEKVKL